MADKTTTKMGRRVMADEISRELMLNWSPEQVHNLYLEVMYGDKFEEVEE